MTNSGSVAPAFDERLQLALDYAGLTAGTARRRLLAVGVPCGENHLYKLLDGSSTNPPFLLVAGLSRVLGVAPGWFFDTDVTDDVSVVLVHRYGQATAAAVDQQNGGENR